MPTSRPRKGLVRRNESGQSAIEFLFMVPFLVMILTMSAQFYNVHRAKFDAVVKHRNSAIQRAMQYNALPRNAAHKYSEPPVEEKVSIVIRSKVFPSDLKVSSSGRDYIYYAGTGRR